jgi:hypothetical protein
MFGKKKPIKKIDIEGLPPLETSDPKTNNDTPDIGTVTREEFDELKEEIKANRDFLIQMHKVLETNKIIGGK